MLSLAVRSKCRTRIDKDQLGSATESISALQSRKQTHPKVEKFYLHRVEQIQSTRVLLKQIHSDVDGVVCLLCILAVEQSRPPGYTPLATFRSSPVANEMSSLSSTQGSHPGLWCDRLSSRLLSCYSRQLLTFASDF